MMKQNPTHKSTSQVVLLISNAVLGAFFFGYAVSYMNPAIKTLDIQLELTGTNKGLLNGVINALLPIGAAFGAILSSMLLQSFSNRQAFMITDMICILGCGIQLYLHLGTIMVARFIIGMGVGLNSSLVPQFIKEFSPSALSGSLGAMNQMTVNLGVLLGLTLGLGFEEDGSSVGYLRLVFDLPMILCALRTFFLLTVYTEEPPRYYLNQGDEKSARRVVQWIYKQEYVNSVLDRLRDESIAMESSKQTYSDLFTNPAMKTRVIIGCLLCVLQQFSGINAVLIYSSSIFEDLTDAETKNILNIAVGVTNLVVSAVAIPCLKRVGRRPLLLYGTIGCGACLLGLSVFAYFQSGIPTLILMFAYLIAFQLSLGPVVWIYLADILPEKGVSLAVLTNWTSCAVVAQTFGFMNSVGIELAFGVYGLCCVLGVVFVFTMVKETKDKSSATIDNMFSLVGKIVDE